METATWVIAFSSLVNVMVLAVYAYFTWGIWKETQQGAQQTQSLVRQSRDAVKAPVMNFVLNVEEAIKARASATHLGGVGEELEMVSQQAA